MSYDDPDNPSPAPRRPLSRGRALVVAAALVPVGLGGWLLWQGVSGAQDSGSDAVTGKGEGQEQGQGETGSATATPSASAASGQPSGDTATSSSPSSPSSPSSTSSQPNPSRSPSPSRTTPLTGPLKGKVVVIDPGHNLRNRDHPTQIARQVDVGTHRKECDTTGTATNTGYSEAAFNLDLAHRLRKLLEEQGATVKLTQDNDRPYGPCIDERARIGNEAKADAAVSLHADGSSAGNRGFHVILPGKVKAGAADTSAIVAPSRELGERIAGGFVRRTGNAPSNYIGGGTGLDVRKDLGGLNLSKVPKVFIECGNMRDADDAAQLTNGTWQQKAARGISEGIAGFLSP